MSLTGILLVGHGTRSPQGTEEFLTLARRVKSLWSEGPVAPCFLELQGPDIHTAGTRLVARGVESVIVVPVLLFAAGHALRDIPAALQTLQAAHPEVKFLQSEPLRLHPDVMALSRTRFREACGDDDAIDFASSLLVMVGRGSLNNDATHDMLQFSAMRARLDPFADVTTAFVAMCQPTLGDALQYATAGGYRTVIVQPHLLFQGELSRKISRMVCGWASRYLSQRWIVPSPLGPADEIATALVDRARARREAALVQPRC